MSENVTEAGKGLGIASLVLGIIALVISFVPCLGMYALIPGIIAIVLGGVAYMQANKGNSPKGLIIAALVISILGTAIAGWQYSVLASAANGAKVALEEMGIDVDNIQPEDIETLGEELEGVIEEAVEEAKAEEGLEEALEEVVDEVAEETEEKVE